MANEPSIDHTGMPPMREVVLARTRSSESDEDSPRTSFECQPNAEDGRVFLDSYHSMPSGARGTLRVTNADVPDETEEDAVTTSHRHSSFYSQSDSSFEISPARPIDALESDYYSSDSMDEVDLDSSPELPANTRRTGSRWRTFTRGAKLNLPAPAMPALDGASPAAIIIPSTQPSSARQPFKRWMRSLSRKNSKPVNKLRALKSLEGYHDSDEEDGLSQNGRPAVSHKKSTSFSSSAFVTAIRTASMSLASFNLPPRVRRSDRSSRRRSGHRSSRSMEHDTRVSSESKTVTSAPVLDEAVRKRAVQRRRILEELISSEEGYIGDMKTLINVYFTLLASVPTLSQQTQTSIRRNVHEILQLHEELLGELHRVVPNSEINQEQSARSANPLIQHLHWRALDAVPESGTTCRRSGRVPLTSAPEAGQTAGLTAEPQVAADVARVFQKMMRRLFAYEEYGAKYKVMVADAASTFKTIPSWSAYERGIEALASSMSSINARATQDHKGLTFGDLLIKPIQRVCRYPLLFAELAKQTPVCDCPESHAELEKVLYRLREAVREINQATDDPRVRKKIEKTWMLQDKLVFPDQNSQAIALRMLGHVNLCGVLHVLWQTPKGLENGYMLIALFRSYLLFGTARKSGGLFDVAACVSLDTVRLEKADNGKGLQCHTTPYTWKILFEVDNNLHEVMLSACSGKEESVWKNHIYNALEEGLSQGLDDTFPRDVLSVLCLDLKPIDNAFGRRSAFARRIAAHRLTTAGCKTAQCPVIIKNTHHFLASPDRMPMYVPPSMSRSQSQPMNHPIAVVSSRRAERARLEGMLEDVWTQEILPFPGMGGRRVDHPIKVSATSMIRKLSIASITSNFSRRSSIANAGVSGVEAEAVDEGMESNACGRTISSDSSIATGVLSHRNSANRQPSGRVVSSPLRSTKTRTASGRIDENEIVGINQDPAASAVGESPSRRGRGQSAMGLSKLMGYLGH